MANNESQALARAHVDTLPMVQNFLDRVNKSKIAPLFRAYYEEFMNAPAATTMHHNFTHGLVIHTSEMWIAAERFLKAAPFSVALHDRIGENGSGDGSSFSIDELFVAVALHDFAKIKQYEAVGGGNWKKVRMICNQETWTLRELSKFGIELTDNELVALLHAEGGYTEFEVDWRPMSVIVHAADLWSSQAMRCMWDVADEMKVMCPLCGAAMSSRNGPRGPFFGCTKYPNCRGIKDAGTLPNPDALFLAFLKRQYPIADEIAEPESAKVTCTCGEPETPGIVHKSDSPCTQAEPENLEFGSDTLSS